MAWLWPVLSLVLGLALIWTEPDPAQHDLLWRLTVFDASLSTGLIVFLVTPAGQRRLEPIFGAVLRGLLLAALVFPEVRHFLWLEFALAAFGLKYVVQGLRKPLPAGFDELDDLERTYAYWLRFSAAPKVHQILLFELTLLKHLLLRPRLPEGEHFGTRRGASTGSTFVLLVFFGLVEGLLAHTLLRQWNEAAAWIWTGAELLGLLWLLAYGRALAVRPVTVGQRRLYLRSGLRWTASTPLANVTGVRRFDSGRDAQIQSIAVDVTPNVVLNFTAPVRLYGLYHQEWMVREIALHVDDLQPFMVAVQPARSAQG